MKALDPNARLTFLERFAYGLGDYSCNLVYSAISAFLLVYYTDVLGVAATTAGGVMAVSKIFDGASDLIMGRIVDNTKSKWGKARPWILRMSIPLAVCTVLMFSVPGSLTGAMQIGYIFLSYNLVSTVFYTGLNVPYARALRAFGRRAGTEPGPCGPSPGETSCRGGPQSHRAAGKCKDDCNLDGYGFCQRRMPGV